LLPLHSILTPREWNAYLQELSDTEQDRIIAEINNSTSPIICLIAGIFSLPRSRIHDYFRSNESVKRDIDICIATIEQNRFNHFSYTKLQAFKKALLYHTYGLRYKMTVRDWRLVRNLLWIISQLRYSYPELYVDVNWTRGLTDLTTILGPRAYVDGFDLKSPSFRYLARNNIKLSQYRKYRIWLRRKESLRTQLNIIIKNDTGYTPLPWKHYMRKIRIRARVLESR
jgi:hypothetical protein